MGTPLYMSPEQATGLPARPASDQYSLGVILFELLTGERIFEGSADVVMFHHAQSDPPSPRSVAPAISRDLEMICLKCLEKKPEHRYPNDQELALDLKRLLQGEPIGLRRLGVIERTLKWARRKPALASAYGASIAAVLLLAVATTMTSLCGVGRELGLYECVPANCMQSE